MNGQQSLFGDFLPEQPTPVSLRIAKSGTAPLSKAQRAFNRLLARIERLRAEIAAKGVRLDEDLAFYGATLHPLNQASVSNRKELVRLLGPLWKGGIKPALGKRQKETLAEILTFQLNAIAVAEGGLFDEDLKGIYALVAGQDFADFEEDQFSDFREEMEDLFDEAGMDVDLSELRRDAPPEEFLRKMAELEAKLREAEEGVRQREQVDGPPAKKGKRQLAQEERERLLAEARARNIGTVYKQLARALHPDLEPDPVLRLNKETLMKELTVAYKQGDLYTLLKLELEWLQREEGDVARLSEEKLSVYNEVLKEQCETLEEEYRMLPMQPRYQPLHQYAGGFGLGHLDRQGEKARAEALVKSQEEAIARLRGPEAHVEVRDILRSYQQSQRQQRFDGPY